MKTPISMLKIGCVVLVAASICMMALRSLAQGTTSPDSGHASGPWAERLESMKPSNAMAYFELAEEIADAAADRDQRELARHLFALAGALDPEHLGRSACLALADFEENPTAKRRLLALAALLGPGIGASGLSSGESKAAPSVTAVLAVGEAMSDYRKGRGPQALTALKKPGALELLTQYDRMVPGGILRFQEDCKLYHGQSKPSLSTGDVSRMLRFEIALLAGADRSWPSEILLTGGQPLVEVDPERLEESLNVDASRPYYRKGRWVSR